MPDESIQEASKAAPSLLDEGPVIGEMIAVDYQASFSIGSSS